MKFRTGFVTNSSSSSYIVSHATKDDMYNLIRGLYEEFREKFFAFEPYAADYHMELNDVGDGRFEYRFENEFQKNKEWEVLSRFNQQAKKQFGVDAWSIINKEEEWEHCETYDEYEQYWKDRMIQAHKDKEPYVHAPFSIADYRNPKELKNVSIDGGYYPNHECRKETDGWGYRENPAWLVRWYIPCAEAIFEEGKTFKHSGVDPEEYYNGYCSDCPLSRDNCFRLFADVNEGKTDPIYLMNEYLGNICVHSESGYIPYDIARELQKLCDHSCQHMG